MDQFEQFKRCALIANEQHLKHEMQKAEDEALSNFISNGIGIIVATYSAEIQGLLYSAINPKMFIADPE